MHEPPVYYQPPQEHDQHIRIMLRRLLIFFICLFSVLVLVILNAHHLAAHLPFSVEKRFVRPYEAMADHWYDGKTLLETQAYVTQLVDQLSLHGDLPEEIQIEVHVLDSDIPNAFATLGGHIFVFTGLIKTVADENSLAMVLAHEIAHVKHRHPVVSLGRGVALQMLYSFVSGQYRVADLSGQMGLMFFSREQEQQADLDAVAMLHRLYGHVAGYDDFFSTMAERLSEQESDMPQWLSSHPDVRQRITNLHAYIEQQQWYQGDVIALPSAVLTELQSAE